MRQAKELEAGHLQRSLEEARSELAASRSAADGLKVDRHSVMNCSCTVPPHNTQNLQSGQIWHHPSVAPHVPMSWLQPALQASMCSYVCVPTYHA